MCTARHRQNGIVIALSATLLLFAAPAQGQETATIPDPTISRSLTYATGAWALTVGLLYAMDEGDEAGNTGTASLVMLGGLGLTGIAASLGASNDHYRVNPLAPIGVAALGMAGSAVLFGMAWEQDSAGLAIASGVLALVGPPVLATITAQKLGENKAAAARAGRLSARPTLGRTPEGQTKVGLRVALPNH